MIELVKDGLSISFPSVHPKAQCAIAFQRTLRIPDDNQEHFLPPGLGRFPLLHVDDHASRLPLAWKDHGGVFLPMHQAEALWIEFKSDYPFAIKIAAGKVNAVTGGLWDNELHADPQDHVVIPEQPWLDGFCVAQGLIRQFVAMPLGHGYTTEEQITGEAEHGGIQIIAYPMKRQHFESLPRDYYRDDSCCDYELPPMKAPVMGLAPGGLLRQHIFEDRHGLDAWDTTDRSRCFVHLLNSNQYRSVTGMEPPTRPPTAHDYSRAGLPWFDYYDESQATLEGSSTLARLDSVAAMTIKNGKGTLADNGPVEPQRLVHLGNGLKQVREDDF